MRTFFLDRGISFFRSCLDIIYRIWFSNQFLIMAFADISLL